MNQAPRVHDYTASTRGYGHDYVFTPDADPSTASITGWGNGLRVGDHLLLSHDKQPDATALYRLTEVRYEWDPPDMWRAQAVFVPGSSDEGRRIAGQYLAEKRPRSRLRDMIAGGGR